MSSKIINKFDFRTYFCDRYEREYSSEYADYFNYSKKDIKDAVQVCEKYYKEQNDKLKKLLFECLPLSYTARAYETIDGLSIQNTESNLTKKIKQALSIKEAGDE